MYINNKRMILKTRSCEHMSAFLLSGVSILSSEQLSCEHVQWAFLLWAYVRTPSYAVYEHFLTCWHAYRTSMECVLSVCCVLKTCTSTCEQYSECAKCVQSANAACNAACRRMQLVDSVRRTIFTHPHCRFPISLYMTAVHASFRIPTTELTLKTNCLNA